jgi:hypothetical protein
MKDEEDIIYLGAGPGAAILLGAALVPFREATSASNLTFPFLILIIVIAELGGWGPALATAVAVAFLGLATCGLVVSAFAKRRGR